MAVMNQNFRCSWDCQQVERYSHGSTITVSWNLIPVIYGRHILSGPTPPSSPPKTNISKQLGHGESNLLRWAMFEVPMPDFSGVICCLLFVYSLKHYPICSILLSGVCQNTAAFRKSRQDCNTNFAHGRHSHLISKPSTSSFDFGAMIRHRRQVAGLSWPMLTQSISTRERSCPDTFHLKFWRQPSNIFSFFADSYPILSRPT